MSKKYFYGLPDQEFYNAEDIDSAYEDIAAYYRQLKLPIGLIIVEMVESKKSDVRFCPQLGDFGFEPECSSIICDQYSPRNGKNGICKHLRWSLWPTGAKWEIIGEQKYKKLSGRTI